MACLKQPLLSSRGVRLAIAFMSVAGCEMIGWFVQARVPNATINIYVAKIM